MREASDPQVISAFQDGTINVLKVMCHTESVAGKPVLKKDKPSSSAVGGVISLICPEQKGRVILNFSEKAILTIASRMLYEEKSEIDDEIKDVVGELTNMIAGNSRQSLQEVGLSFEAGIPRTTIGENSDLYRDIEDEAEIMIIPFKTDEGDSFTVEITFSVK